ncbi:unnamed protein product [Nesidiocoris tenuis]|uniref:Uncharacterized protein n=1 Tax=Nesidiocoris tenuis TaxID=355587 RepID=A0A6H5HN01_9HEMI|nr:unnamed protein product [Nesidiocoris tenuis]
MGAVELDFQNRSPSTYPILCWTFFRISRTYYNSYYFHVYRAQPGAPFRVKRTALEAFGGIKKHTPGYKGFNRRIDSLKQAEESTCKIPILQDPSARFPSSRIHPHDSHLAGSICKFPILDSNDTSSEVDSRAQESWALGLAHPIFPQEKIQCFWVCSMRTTLGWLLKTLVTRPGLSSSNRPLVSSLPSQTHHDEIGSIIGTYGKTWIFLGRAAQPQITTGSKMAELIFEWGSLLI